MSNVRRVVLPHPDDLVRSYLERRDSDPAPSVALPAEREKSDEATDSEIFDAYFGIARSDAAREDSLLTYTRALLGVYRDVMDDVRRHGTRLTEDQRRTLELALAACGECVELCRKGGRST